MAVILLLKILTFGILTLTRTFTLIFSASKKAIDISPPVVSLDSSFLRFRLFVTYQDVAPSHLRFDVSGSTTQR